MPHSYHWIRDNFLLITCRLYVLDYFNSKLVFIIEEMLYINGIIQLFDGLSVKDKSVDLEILYLNLNRNSGILNFKGRFKI